MKAIMNRFKNIFLIITIGLLTTLVSCNKNNTTNPKSGTANFSMTDAPIDNANVSGTFVTVSQIKVDGQAVNGFQKTTINLMNYQNGMSKLLGKANLDAQSYNTVSLVLDYDHDASGNAPGCYVETTGNVKHKLSSTTNTFTINHNFNVKEASNDTLVFDFNLRKAVTMDTTSTDTTYNFVTSTEMNNAIRVVNSSNTGTIQGKLSNNTSGSDKVVVYAYEKGTYSSSEENPEGESHVRFAHAVTSAVVDSNGNYKLGFLPSGDYEVHFASYKKDSEGHMKMNGMLMLNALGSLNLNSLSVSAHTTLTLNVSFTGMMPVSGS